MLNKKWFACATLAFAAAISGCSSTGNKNAADAGSGDAVKPTSTGSVATTASSGNSGSSSAYGTAPAANQSVVYFDFDSSELKAESKPVVAGWAKYLTANPTAKVQLQGNTDERGTREYNIALGERRAQSVSSALQSAGVAAGQLSLTSFGEEKPVALGHDEASWSQNRRVEIVAQ
ncbi:MAG: peptidoglycan-associated lipoprotein Pal [Nevskia sp.]